MRMTLDQLVERAVAAEAAGFGGIALMDHLAPPMADDQAMYEAMVTATWLAARTEALTVGHLVLCDAFRHPALLARQAVTLDHASGGRFELGIGWGSVPTEHATFGVGSQEPKVRVARLRETLEVLRLLWSGEVVSYEGEHHALRDAQQRPVPARPIPIVIGGAGPATRRLVAEHAEWWNVPVHRLDVLDESGGTHGAARVSVQQMVALVPSEAARADVETTARRRFGGMAASGGLVIGDAAELRAHFDALADRGVERTYAWFADFAPPATLAAFSEVVARFP
ncbi:MAG: LLM class flavin-dependent oxidoreductase [Acidimicrobiia bacterium]|nr:LLM class flavin-dependent oxidoreductase [Acidimicrobiia bacterium]